MGTASGSLTASTISMSGDGGDEIEAYLARPAGSDRRGGVVVIHHLPGYDRGMKEITRRFAEVGYDAICPNLYSRQAPGAEPVEAAQLVRAQGGISDAQLLGDAAGAAAHLRSLDASNGKVGVVGYCSGGRQSVLAACNLDLDAAVDCYGAFVTGIPPEGFPLTVTNLVDQLPNLRCPLLGLFGNDDAAPSPAHVDELEQILTREKKTFELHRYDGAGHAFFSADRSAYRVDAANDGWQRIGHFFGRYLAEP
jgi:carboxymethylenebutenolidase